MDGEQIDERTARNVALPVLLQSVADYRYEEKPVHLQSGIEHSQVRLLQVLGEPVGGY